MMGEGPCVPASSANAIQSMFARPRVRSALQGRDFLLRTALPRTRLGASQITCELNRRLLLAR